MPAFRSAIYSALQTLQSWVRAHKFWSAVLAAALIFAGFIAYQKLTSTAGEARYVLGSAEIGTIVSSVTVSGQVSASDQLDVKPKVSGEVLSLNVSAGDKVKAGAVLARIDSEAAQKAVRDARANLETAQLSLEKLKKPAEKLSLLQSQNAVTNAEDALDKQYKDSLTHVSDAFQDFPDLMESLKDIEIGTDTNHNLQWNIDYYQNAVSNYDIKVLTFRTDAYSSYLKARASYDKAFADYSAVGVTADTPTTEKLLAETYQSTQDILGAVKSANAFIQFYKDVMTTHNSDVSSVATQSLESLNTHLGTINGHLSALLSDINGLKSGKQSVAEKKASLEDTEAGADTLDIQSSQLSVTKAQNSLADAESNLADYTVRAPYDATVASVGVKKFDTVSSGSILATLITSQKVAELSLNEVDVSKIAVGNKATLTFDAVEGLTLTGKVAEIDAVGEVSQGVVSYTIKIAFDALDERVKPGMTVDTSIITDSKQDILTVPSGAVKTASGEAYVLAFDPPLPAGPVSGQGVLAERPPTQVPVVVGITDDTATEIVSGLTEGQQVVIRTVNSASQSATQAPSIFGTPGGNARPAGATGGVRFQGR